MFTELEDVAADDHHRTCGFALLKAQLASFLDAVEAGDMDRLSAEALRDAFQDELKANGVLDAAGKSGPDPLPGDVLWRTFVVAVTRVADDSHPTLSLPHSLADTRDPNPQFAGNSFISLGPLHFHSALIRHGASLLAGHDDLSAVDSPEILLKAHDLDWLARCGACLTRALADGAFAAAYLKGRPDYIVWLAPEVGRVDELAAQRSGSRLASVATDELRDLLGLWAEDGHKIRPLAMFRIDGSKLHAPNVISASGYERFRHRAGKHRRSTPTAGLTFNLDSRERPARPGASEVIAVGVTMGAVSEAIACGMPSPIDRSPQHLLATHKDYAKHVSRNRSWTRILERLEELLK